MNKKALAWLYEQLPELVAKGVLPADSAEELKRYYGPVEDNVGTRTYLMVFGIIGVTLVGLGIILILAHNWANISRVNRLIIAVSLLIAAQVFAGSVLHFKRDSKVWRESAATLQMLMIGATIAMVGQTYHLIEDTDAFLFTWLLLSLPLMYLLRSTSVAVLYTIGLTYWSLQGYFSPDKQLVWVLFLLVLPYYRQLSQHNRYANPAVVLAWTMNLGFYFYFAAAFDRYIHNFSLLIYSSLLSINYMIGVLWFNNAPAGWRNPFKVIGLAGGLGFAFVMTFNGIWDNLRLSTGTVDSVEATLIAIALLLAGGGNIKLARQTGQKYLKFSLAPVVVNGAYLIQSYDASGIGATLLMNGYLLFISVSIIRSGVRRPSIGLVNVGMLVLVALVTARFLDANFSFIIRGLVFVMLGLGFLVANLVLVRRKAGEQHEK